MGLARVHVCVYPHIYRNLHTIRADAVRQLSRKSRAAAALDFAQHTGSRHCRRAQAYYIFNKKMCSYTHIHGHWCKIQILLKYHATRLMLVLGSCTRVGFSAARVCVAGCSSFFSQRAFASDRVCVCVASHRIHRLYAHTHTHPRARRRSRR